MMWEPGTLVLCVDDNPNPPWLGRMAYSGCLDGLTKGAVYTIRRCGAEPYWGGPAVWLQEIIREIDPGYEIYGEGGYHPARFRPLKSSSLDVFRKALEPAPNQTEDA